MIDNPELQLATVTSEEPRPSAQPAPPPGVQPAGPDGEIPLRIGTTNLEALCRIAMADVAKRFAGRAVQYAPDPDPTREGRGDWDARRVAYAVTILLEDALKRTAGDRGVSLRWREDDECVVLRVQYPRALERGDVFVTGFEDGVTPDGADDEVGTLRVAAALKIARQHGGTLGRIRTHAGTAYVLELPRKAVQAG